MINNPNYQVLVDDSQHYRDAYRVELISDADCENKFYRKFGFRYTGPKINKKEMEKYLSYLLNQINIDYTNQFIDKLVNDKRAILIVADEYENYANK